jgi:hypothetical protein
MPGALNRLGAFARAFSRGDAGALRGASVVLAWAILLGSLLHVLGPMLRDFSTYGFHDWDVASAYRYITVLSWREYGEGPWWHPFLCGGVPAFGYVEGATNLISPFLPVYLLFDIRTAIRVEVVVQAVFAMAGAYLLASRFTKSAALSALLAALFVLNGRYAFQVASGHTWHLGYSLMPWAFYLFDRAHVSGRVLAAAWSGVAIALQCYLGAIYPLPHTALFLSVYALLLALVRLELRPLLMLAVAGSTAFGLAAPKLLAVLDHMRDLPRLIESKEVIGVKELFVMLLAPEQRFNERPVPVPAYNWHEWGIYVGAGGVLVLVTALLFARGPRENLFKLLGFACLLLGFGAFHPASPWALLHELPIFASQHVPSRFHVPMLLFFGVAFVGFAGRAVDAWTERRPKLALFLLVPLSLFAWDMARYSRIPMEQAFWMRAPEQVPRRTMFDHRRLPPVQYLRRDWAAPILLSMFANTGVIRCYGVDPNFVPGALPSDLPRYPGLAYVAQGSGSAKVVEWTPNRAVIEVRGATPGALLVYNMNHDPSFRANGEPALEWNGVNAKRIESVNERVEFSYFPRTLRYSWLLPLLTMVTLGALSPLVRARIREWLGRWRAGSAPQRVRDDARAVHVEPKP